MSIFMFGSLIAGFSQTIIQLIVCRGIAGAGGGGIVSIAQIVISDVVTLRDRCVIVAEYAITMISDVFLDCQRKISRDYWCCSCTRLCYWTADWRCFGTRHQLEGVCT